MTEVLVAGFLIALIAGMVAFNARVGYQRGLEDTAYQRMAVLAQAIRHYEIDTGSLPPKLDDLTTTESISGQPYDPNTSIHPPYFYAPGLQGGPSLPLDPFRERNTPLSLSQRYFRWTPAQHELRSSGRDGIFSTSDDLCFDVMTVRKKACN